MSFYFPETSDTNPVFLNKQLELLYNKITENPKDYPSQKQYAEILLERPNKDRALRAKKSLEIILTEKEGGDINSEFLYLNALRFTGETKKAKYLAEQGIEKYPNTAGFHVQLISILMTENNMNQAEDYLNTALKKFHNDEKIIRLEIKLHMLLNNWEKSLTLCNEALQSHPEDQRIVIGQIQSLSNLNRTHEAVQVCEKFKDEFPQQFSLAMWDVKGDYLPCSFYYALLCKIMADGKSNEHQIISVKNNQFNITSNLTEEAKSFLKKAIDETTDILSNTEYHASQNNIKFLQARCYQMLEKFEETMIILDEIPSEYDTRIKQTLKIKSLFFLKKYQKCIDMGLTFLDSFPDERTLNKIIALCYLGLGNTKEFEKLYPNTETSKQVDGSFHINKKESYDNYQKFMDFLYGFSGTLCIKNSYTKASLVNDIRKMVRNPNNKVTKVRIIGGLFDKYDGGDQFYNEYLDLKKQVQLFNAQSKKLGCRIEFKINNDGVHARYFMDDNQVYNGTGKEQIELNQIDDFLLVTKNVMVDEIRKTWNELWNSPDSIQLPKTDNDTEEWKKMLRKYKETTKTNKDKEKNIIPLISEIEYILHSDESKKS